MSQGYTGYTIVGRDVAIADGPNLDAFSRLRVSNPLTIFSNQFTYDASPLIFEQAVTDPVTCFITHSSTDRLMVLSMINATGLTPDTISMQSYEYIPYQPGRSQLVFITFNFFPSDPIGNDTIKTVGLGDTTDGFFFRYNGASGRPEFVILSTTNNGTQIAQKNNWNLDRLDGTGPSGITLDLTKTQILVIDFQALYVGRVRFGFDIDGRIIYAHEFLHANSAIFPYISTANLPIRASMEAVSLGFVSTDMYFICCSVASEGGSEDTQRFGYNFAYGDVATITSTAAFDYCMQLRPRTVFNGFTNRSKFILTELDFLNLGNRSIKWQLTIGDTASGAWNDVNTNYSAMEYATGGTYITGTTIVIDEGYAPAAGGNKSNIVSSELASKYPITLDVAGNPRDLGTLTLSAQLLTAGTSDLYFTMKWKEVR